MEELMKTLKNEYGFDIWYLLYPEDLIFYYYLYHSLNYLISVSELKKIE